MDRLSKRDRALVTLGTLVGTGAVLATLYCLYRLVLPLPGGAVSGYRESTPRIELVRLQPPHVSCRSPAIRTDPLPAWNDGTAKDAIVTFVCETMPPRSCGKRSTVRGEKVVNDPQNL
jgi:hypothetical protein